MKTHSLLPLAMIFFACGGRSSYAPPETTETRAATLQETATLSEPEVVAIESNANKGEVELGRLTMTTSSNPSVRTFAAMMIAEHSEAEARLMRIVEKVRINPIENAISTKLRTESEATISKLQPLEGVDFDRGYIESQVRMHRDLHSLIDQKLKPSAQTPELKVHLDEVRRKVAKHLARAQEIDVELQGVASAY